MPLLRVHARDVVRRLRDAERLRGDPDAAAVERRHRDPEAAALLVQQAVALDPCVLEHEVRGRRGVQAELLLLARDPDVPGVEDEARDATRALGRRVGPREEDERAGTRAVRDPLLRAVQHPAVAVRSGRGPERSRVGAGAGLGQRERAEALAASERWHEARPLLVGAEGEDRQRRRARVHGDGDADARVRARELLEDEDVGDEVRARAAVLLRDAHAHEAELRELREQLVGEAMLAIPLGRVRGDLAFGELARERLDRRAGRT